MQIVLARHGRPVVNQRNWIAPYQLREWIRTYDEGGVFVDAIPSDLADIAASCRFVVSSPLLRCTQSAKALASLREVHSEQTVREAGLPYPGWRFPRLPVSLWLVMFRVAWFFGYAANFESKAEAGSRASHAASTLIALAKAHKSVFVMGHGIMNAFIARDLLVQGWVGPKRPANGFWEVSVYRKPLS
jgi:broad specificity phosphatase PhoE